VAAVYEWTVLAVLRLAPATSPAIEVPPPEATAPIEIPPAEPAAPIAVPPPDPGTAEAPGPDAGGPVGIDLEWRAAPGCPTPDRVVAVIEALVRREVVIDPTGAVVARADVVADANRWRIDLEVDGPGGSERRRLQADACDVLSEAAALVIATNIDPARVARSLEEAGAAPTAAAPAASTPPRDGPRTGAGATTPAGRRRVAMALVVVGGPALGAAPKVTGWLQGGVNVSIGRAVIGAYGGHGFARRADGDARLSAALTTGGLRGCFAPTQGRLAVPLCGLFEAGAVSARADGDTTRRDRGLWLGAGAGAAVEWAPHPRVALVGGVDALVAIVRPQFHVDGPAGTAADYRVAPAAVRAMLGISVRLR
jgi:hypothetical protein